MRKTSPVVATGRWRRPSATIDDPGSLIWHWTLSGCIVIAVLLAWYLATVPLQLLSALQFPSPQDAYDSLVRLMQPGYAGATLSGHILSSVELVVLGFAAAVGTGVPLGLLMGRSRVANAYFNTVFQIVRPIAPIAWIPLTILWFGLGMTAKLFVIWLAAFAPIVINTIAGAGNIDPILVAAAKVHGATRRQILLDVVIPGALPAIFTGLRVSLQACWMVLVAAELVGSFTGLGHIMIIATRDLDTGMIFVAMVTVSILGVAFTLALGQLERWMIPWRR